MTLTPSIERTWLGKPGHVLSSHSLGLAVMPPEPLNIHIDLVALQATFFRRLQHQLDVTKILQAGCDAVTAEQVEARKEFGAFVPANGAQLPHDQAKVEAHDWLLRGFLRDAIEGTGLFLDECLCVCALMQVAARGAAKGAEMNRLFYDLARANHRLHLPQKLEKLEREFGVTTRFNSHVLSLNRARTCVVHRLGTVSAPDVDETGTLKLTFQRAQFVARGQESGNQLLLDQPGIVLTEDSMVELHFVDNERTFGLGERVRLHPSELYDTIITLWRFGLVAAPAIEGYGRSIGVVFEAPKSEA